VPGAARIQPLRRSPAVERIGPLGWAGGPGDAGAARVPEHEQVPGIVPVPIDDAGTHHRADPAAGAGSRRAGPLAHGVRAGAVLLLYAPHPADSTDRLGRVVA